MSAPSHWRPILAADGLEKLLPAVTESNLDRLKQILLVDWILNEKKTTGRTIVGKMCTFMEVVKVADCGTVEIVTNELRVLPHGLLERDASLSQIQHLYQVGSGRKKLDTALWMSGSRRWFLLFPVDSGQRSRGP